MNLTTLARPYAQAAFLRAEEVNQLDAWQAMLIRARAFLQDALMQHVLNDPRYSTQQLRDLLCGLLGLTGEQQDHINFIDVLAENKRLALLATIADLFIAYRAIQEKTLMVDVTSATELSAAYQATLIDALTKRLQRKISLQCTIDPALLGGVLIQAGDTVIDGSVSGKLKRLMEFILNAA